MATKGFNSDNSKISKEELYHILRKIVGYESSNSDSTGRTSIFHGIDCAMLLKRLLKHKIGIIEFEKGDTIISEGKGDCNYFFLLLKGELSIYKADVLITSIKTISVVGEMGFLTKSERTATVKANSYSYLLPLDQFFIDSLPIDAQVKIFRNLAIETGRKLDFMNRDNCLSKCLKKGLEKFPDDGSIDDIMKKTTSKLEIVGQLII